MQVETSQENSKLISPELGSSRVLVADDEPVICETLQLYLQELGIEDVQTAFGGKEALEKLDMHKHDFVFVDLMMPDCSGMDVLKQINHSHQLTNVIIMTGYPSMGVVIDAMHHGASDFLVKPFRFQDVKLTLERIQRLHLLMEKNWLLHQELNKKKEVEELNCQLEKRIRLQTTLYNIVDSLSKITRPEELYHYVIKKAVESCNAKKACFMIYDQADSSLLAFAQQGLDDIYPGTKARLQNNACGEITLDDDFLKAYFGRSNGKSITLLESSQEDDLIAVPFKIREEPFGILLVGDKAEKRTFEEDDEFLLKFLAEKAALNIENLALYDNLKQNLIASLMALVSAIEAKDPYTQQHSSRVTEFSISIALKMDCSIEDIQRIESSGPLHDIGKIGIKDSILNKPGRLTEDEFSHIKSHPIIGVNIVSPLGLDCNELSIIRNHHERWDGQGYPDALKNEDIPRLSRILAVADAFDAMNSNRAYRKALPFSACLDELRKNSGSQFDPKVVEAALSVFIAK